MSNDFQNTKQCIELLTHFVNNRGALAELDDPTRRALLTVAGRLSRPLRIEQNQLRKTIKRRTSQLRTQKSSVARAETEIRKVRQAAVYMPPSVKQLAASDERGKSLRLEKPQNCYVCKAEYQDLHFFYDSMCQKCGDFNYSKRFYSTRLDGKVAIVTGARVKIGYQTSLKLLRAGARVVATSRFPNDCANRYIAERDFSEFSERLVIIGLDLRHLPSVEGFANYFTMNFDRLDILVNNAAQTVRRPDEYYGNLIAAETKSDLTANPERLRILKANHELRSKLLTGANLLDGGSSTQLWPKGDSQVARTCSELFPIGKLDADLQQMDLRSTNSWRMRLDEVTTEEVLEVHLINAFAPFVLCSKLKPIMKSTAGIKFIINASAMEGKFSRHVKTDKHPHTNMAKAALNMMTLTSAPDFARDLIFVNAVDTGWVTDEDPVHLAERKTQTRDFQPPLDIVDGAARLVDPIFCGIDSGNPIFGKFLKDYFPTTW